MSVMSDAHFFPPGQLSSRPYPHRKRRAASPPSPILSFDQSKRRRPNLADGFSSLCLNPREERHPSPLLSYQDSQAAHRDVDDEDHRLDDVKVEEVPDQLGSLFPYSQPDRIEPPDASPELPVESAMHPGDIHSDFTRGRKRHASPDAASFKRPRHEEDVDMDMIAMGQRQAQYELEKDRIIVTSLSSPSSSRSSSRSSSPTRSRLTQPGSQGFTFSPSLLTHLLTAQREQCLPSNREQGLVLYRPPQFTSMVSRWEPEGSIEMFGLDDAEMSEDAMEVE